MKIQGEHYEFFRAMAEAGLERLNAAGLTQESYLARDARISNIEKTKDLLMRHRWDCLWAGRRVMNHEGQFPGDYQDAHIDTALKKIVAECKPKAVEQDAEAQLDEEHDQEQMQSGVTR